MAARANGLPKAQNGELAGFHELKGSQLALALVAVAWLATFFLKEIPLRKSNVPEEEPGPAAQAAPQAGAGGDNGDYTKARVKPTDLY